jgi:VanZ family protein
LALIFYFSSQPNLKSELAPFWDLILRKIAHMAEYFVLAFLLFRALDQYRISFKNSIITAGFLALAYSVSDEFHQSFVARRVASFIDVCIDGLGIISFVFLKFFEKRY